MLFIITSAIVGGGLAVFAISLLSLPTKYPKDPEVSKLLTQVLTTLTNKQEHIVNLINIGAISVQSNPHDSSFTLSNQDGNMTLLGNGAVFGQLSNLILGEKPGNQIALYQLLVKRLSEEKIIKSDDYISNCYTKYIAGDHAPDPEFQVNPNSLAVIEQQNLQKISDRDIALQTWNKILIAVEQGKIKVTKEYSDRDPFVYLEWGNTHSNSNRLAFTFNEKNKVWVYCPGDYISKGNIAKVLNKGLEEAYRFSSYKKTYNFEFILKFVSNEQEAARQLRKNMGLDDLEDL